MCVCVCQFVHVRIKIKYNVLEPKEAIPPDSILVWEEASVNPWHLRCPKGEMLRNLKQFPFFILCMHGTTFLNKALFYIPFEWLCRYLHLSINFFFHLYIKMTMLYLMLLYTFELMVFIILSFYNFSLFFPAVVPWYLMPWLKSRMKLIQHWLSDVHVVKVSVAHVPWILEELTHWLAFGKHFNLHYFVLLLGFLVNSGKVRLITHFTASLLSLVWHKAGSLKHPVGIELTPVVISWETHLLTLAS